MSSGVGSDLMAPAERSAAALQTNAAQIHRALAQMGTGSIFNHPIPQDRDGANWELDPLPLSINALEWESVSRALEQRATVLRLLLEDLFGPQRLLAGGHLPTLAILAHEEYLRCCVGIGSPGSSNLVLYSSDVARSIDGEFLVLADRTQMPWGIGHALQNREVMARVNPEAMEQHRVAPLESWLGICRTALGALAPPQVAQPRIVMMTPGTSVSAHSEHAFLARKLGFTLVEPGDLTVRGAKVWLKSVAGLEPVHVILRLVASPDCDPLELGFDSTAGVAGLVEACRRGNVAVANPLGSGLGECAALLPYIPSLTRTLLGEDPRIQSPPTWWCGESSSRSHVLAHLDSLLIRSHHRINGRHTLFGRLLCAEQREELARRITAEPHLFVGQQEVDIAPTPSFDSASAGTGTPTGTVVGRPTISRAFLVRDHDGYHCLEGGLTLTGAQPEAITFGTFSLSKDTWITQSHSALEHPTLALGTTLAPIDLRSSLASRAAESMFWIGRNLERSRCMIRLVGAVGLLNETRHDLRQDHPWPWTWNVDRLLNSMAGLGWLPTPAPPDPPTTAELLNAALVDRSRERSLSTSLHFLLHNAASVRELFSSDSWRFLGQVSDYLLSLATAGPEEAGEIAASCAGPLLALSGVVNDSMVREPGWQFLDIGRRVEVASLVITTIATVLVDDLPRDMEAPLFETILVTWDGLGAYRRRYRSDIDAALLIDLLVTDSSNPRSVRSQLEALAIDIESLPGASPLTRDLLDKTRGLSSLIEASSPDSLAAAGALGRREALEILTDSARETLAAIATEIDLRYFVHVRPTTIFGGSSAPGSGESIDDLAARPGVRGEHG